MNRRSRRIRYMAACTLSTVGLALAHGAETGAATNRVGTTIPHVGLRDLAGCYRVLTDLCYAGPEQPAKPRSPMVLNFFALNCKYCVEELPAFLEVGREFKKKSAKFFLVVTDPLSKDEQVRNTVGQLDCDVLRDPYQVACKKFGVQGLPRTFVIAADGTIVADIAGFKPDYAVLLREKLALVTPLAIHPSTAPAQLPGPPQAPTTGPQAASTSRPAPEMPR
jgi:peroxiredoxin